MLDLSVIIVNYNTRELLVQLLESIMENVVTISYEIIVIDNGSQDGSVELLRSEYGNVHLIRNEENTGFSRANNQGSTLSTAKYLLLLNSDTIVSKGAVETMMDQLESDDKIGIVGPRLINCSGEVQKSCGVFPTLLTEFFSRTFLDRLFPRHQIVARYSMGAWDYSSTRKVEWVTGACMMMGKPTYDALSGFDENFYMFYEDVDLCFRITQMGYSVLYCVESAVTHIGGASWIEFREIPIEHKCRSALYFFSKHFGAEQLLVLRFLCLVEIVLTYIILLPYLLLKGEPSGRIGSRVRGYNKALRHVFRRRFQ